MNKNEIRNLILEKRKKIEEKKIIERGNRVKESFFSLKEFKKANTIMSFVSFGKEICTQNIIKEALKLKKVAVPKIIDSVIAPCLIKNFGELKKGKYGILEPSETNKVSLKDIDIVLVPGIVFDKRGYRIGYGKGYYDVFLNGSDVLKIGLCMDFQIIDKIPNDEWDVKMDMVISEKRIIRV